MFEISSFLATRPPRNGRFPVIAIDGRGGSGKTQLAEYVAGLLPDLTVLNGDDYFEPLDGPLAWGDFNEERFAADLVVPLQQGTTPRYQAYDFERGALLPARDLQVERGLVLERCFAIGLPIDWDLMIWVETPRAVCLQRGIARELMPRERVVAVWDQVWQPREDRYLADVEPQRRATLVVDGTMPFAGQLR